VSDRRLLLVRHGVTDWNREGRFQGHLDPPLADDGHSEAELLAARMAADPLLRAGRIVSSTLRRSMATAEVLATRLGVTFEGDARLIEIGQGEWEGRTHAELEATDADRYAAWRAAASIRQPPGGESIEAATRRVTELFDDLKASDGPWPICLVSHGGTIRILARLLLQPPPTAAWALDVDNASLSVCSAVKGRWRLERWNDTVHLLGRTATHVDESEGRPLSL